VARQTLRSAEQGTLLNAATAYMNLARDTAILELQRSNVRVLVETLRQTRERFAVNDVTRTDVAQAEARLAAGRAAMFGAESNYAASKAIYQQVIGVEPGKLSAAAPVDRLFPRKLADALARADMENPINTIANYNVDVATLQIKIAEGALYPSAVLQGNTNKQFGQTLATLGVEQTLSGSITGAVTAPIYQGGVEYAVIRQAKETLAQRRHDLGTAREQVQQSVQQAWGQLNAAKTQIESATAQVLASEIALNGVREEARLGQRTTLDVLNAQQELVNARVSLVTAQRDRVVASYTVLAQVGTLSPQGWGLKLQIYDPITHYHQVRDSWLGVRTPDGR
jgi:outer membrane protein